MSMTEQKAIEQLKVGYLGDTEELVQAKHIAIKALEKQIPKKVKKQENKILIAEGWEYGCPSCGCGIGTNRNYPEFTQEDEYCPTCGQKLYWEGGE